METGVFGGGGTWEAGVGVDWVLQFVTCLQIFFVFKQKVYCLFPFFQMERGVAGHTVSHFFVGLIKA